jgi:hypothetical protein
MPHTFQISSPSASAVLRALQIHLGVPGGAVGYGIALQAGRSRFRYPMGLLSFFIDLIFLEAV